MGCSPVKYQRLINQFLTKRYIGYIWDNHESHVMILKKQFVQTQNVLPRCGLHPPDWPGDGETAPGDDMFPDVPMFSHVVSRGLPWGLATSFFSIFCNMLQHFEVLIFQGVTALVSQVSDSVWDSVWHELCLMWRVTWRRSWWNVGSMA